MLPRELARKNLLAGLALLAFFVVLFAGTFAVALIWLAAD
jgi:hypothetical protein